MCLRELRLPVYQNGREFPEEIILKRTDVMVSEIADEKSVKTVEQRKAYLEIGINSPYGCIATHVTRISVSMLKHFLDLDPGDDGNNPVLHD